MFHKKRHFLVPYVKAAPGFLYFTLATLLFHAPLPPPGPADAAGHRDPHARAPGEGGGPGDYPGGGELSQSVSF